MYSLYYEIPAYMDRRFRLPTLADERPCCDYDEYPERADEYEEDEE